MYTIYEMCRKTEVESYQSIYRWCVDYRKATVDGHSVVVCDSVSIEDEFGLPVLVCRREREEFEVVEVN